MRSCTSPEAVGTGGGNNVIHIASHDVLSVKGLPCTAWE